MQACAGLDASGSLPAGYCGALPKGFSAVLPTPGPDEDPDAAVYVVVPIKTNAQAPRLQVPKRAAALWQSVRRKSSWFWKRVEPCELSGSAAGPTVSWDRATSRINRAQRQQAALRMRPAAEDDASVMCACF